ncbi:MAG: hypothetical protein D3922_07720 [Candidatus Electrothrix sp. AR1]|nr:hypothetical protein [Candidatus Electrothrix sp. AR1]
MEQNVNEMIAERTILAEEPVESKSEVSNRPIPSACRLGVGIKGFKESRRKKIGYMKRCIVKNIAGIVEMPTIREDIVINNGTETAEQNSTHKMVLSL